MWFLVIFVALLPSIAGAAYVSEEEAVAMHYPEVSDECRRYITARETCRLLSEARLLVESEPLAIRAVNDKKSRLTGYTKEFVLAAYDSIERKFQIIRLDMPLMPTLSFQPRVLSSPCLVERTKGQSFNKMFYKVTCDGRELQVYAAKHLSIPSTFRSRDAAGMTQEATPLFYLSTPPYLVSEEFSESGKEAFLSEASEALRELRSENVPSLAYRGMRVADVMTEWVPLILLLAEQTDPCLLQKRDRGCERLIPVIPFQSDEQTMEAVLAEFVSNGKNAFSRLCSAMAACGAMQFTNKYRVRKGKQIMGTYDAVRLKYPEAKIDPDFRRGTQDIRNGIKAAMLLIDLELSYAPPWVRMAFLRDYRLGLLCTGAAYNGGAAQCGKFAALMMAFQKQHGLQGFSFDNFPRKQFLEWAKMHTLALNRETHGYVEKIWNIYHFLAKYGLQAPVAWWE